MTKRIDTRSRYNRMVCLKTEMDEFVKYIGLDVRLQELKILDIWRECVGEAISKYSFPVELKRNKLFVRVENAVWRYELSLKKEEIINKLNVKLTKNKKNNLIKEIIFV